jgi:heme/copper-type cytochrome/quinol oxidase subunit 2
MTISEKYQIDIFAILTMIVSVLVVIFLIIASVYYGGLVDGKPPAKGESTFLLWTSIILIIIVSALTVYSTIRVFSHKSYMHFDPDPVTHQIQHTTSVSHEPTNQRSYYYNHEVKPENTMYRPENQQVYHQTSLPGHTFSRSENTIVSRNNTVSASGGPRIKTLG